MTVIFISQSCLIMVATGQLVMLHVEDVLICIDLELGQSGF